MGKTTLLRRLALELHRDPYRERFVPLNFPEEQYIEVDRLSKLWLNCLDSMADALEYEGLTNEVRRIDDVVEGLTKGTSDELTLQEEYFSAPGAPVLIAASAVYPTELADYGAAFYDGFKSHYLHPLSLEEVRDVLLHLARICERPQLAGRIYDEMPRLAALRDLTGGNPRTAVLAWIPIRGVTVPVGIQVSV
jgi:hypothetical protein